jgi:flagellar biogenesis protein FliO
MPPEVRLAGLILLLVCPAGLAAQTKISNENGRFSSDMPARESDREWVLARQTTSPPTNSLLESLGRARNQGDTFAQSDPPSLAPANSMADNVLLASYVVPAEPSSITSSAEPSTEPSAAENLPKRLPSPFPAMPPPGTRNSAPAGESSGRFGGIVSLMTVGGSLALVLGLFMILAWIMRRTVPGAVQALPGEVVEVLGRAPLAGRQQVHLIRCGSKLILVSVTPEGAETLTEITDPEEVDRLSGLCRETHPGSATNAFRHVFGQLAPQPTGSGMMVDSGELDLSGMGIVQSADRGAGGHR